MDADRHIAAAIILLALIFASGFFVAAEFAVLTLRRRRVEQVDQEGGNRSIVAFLGAEGAEEISLVTQLGGALSALFLGYHTATWAVATLNRLPPAAAAAVGLAIAGSIYIVFGQQIPRFLGANHPGWVTHPVIFRPLRIMALLLRPLLALFSIILNGISDAMKLSRSAFYAPVHTTADIRELVRHGHEQGVVEEDEREMIHGVFEFSETVAREVMTPRIDIIAVSSEVTLSQLLEVVVDEGHSRIPVYEESIDNIVGVLLAKDLLPVLAAARGGHDRTFDVRSVMREPFFVPDTKRVDEILAEFRQFSVHLAIVIDEFGGTYGLVTMEDLLEEIVGEINDEYDVEEPEFSSTPEGDILIDGGAAISEVNERFGLGIPESDFDTIGGYIFGALGRVAEPGDTVDGVGERGDQVLEVEEAEDRRVIRVRLRGPSAIVTQDN
jgi:putative hemolysin